MSNLKSLMKATKLQRSHQTRITSPLAKYNDLDQLVCIVCKVVIKSDSLWSHHISTDLTHKNNIEVLKKLQQAKKRQRDQNEKDQSSEGIKRQRTSDGNLRPCTQPLYSSCTQPLHSSCVHHFILLFKKRATEPFPAGLKEEKLKEPELMVPSSQHEKLQENDYHYIEPEIPNDFFDDASEQAKIVAISMAEKVTQFGDYSTVEEREEEERALRDLISSMEGKEEEEVEDEIVGVIDLENEPVHEPLVVTPRQNIFGKPRKLTMTVETPTRMEIKPNSFNERDYRDDRDFEILDNIGRR
eukprot:TRINITY_DN4104_c0_g1_i9.p1 TRINITY_DN4104_c0_g1~~TRINITY_DN4104_c0_g1_i9.p1  ORF type:complete len:299 (+),score=69.95 TRINITY_DN4104_c0_g1_i9:972-1868(+)